MTVIFYFGLLNEYVFNFNLKIMNYVSNISKKNKDTVKDKNKDTVKDKNESTTIPPDNNNASTPVENPKNEDTTKLPENGTSDFMTKISEIINKNKSTIASVDNSSDDGIVDFSPSPPKVD